jgi:hypothetical protein
MELTVVCDRLFIFFNSRTASKCQPLVDKGNHNLSGDCN